MVPILNWSASPERTTVMASKTARWAKTRTRITVVSLGPIPKVATGLLFMPFKPIPHPTEHYTRYQDLFETPEQTKAPKVEIISNETTDIASSPELITNTTTSPTIIQIGNDSTTIAPDLTTKPSKKKDGKFYSCFLASCNMTDEEKVCCDNQNLQVLPMSFKSTVRML